MAKLWIEKKLEKVLFFKLKNLCASLRFFSLRPLREKKEFAQRSQRGFAKKRKEKQKIEEVININHQFDNGVFLFGSGFAGLWIRNGMRTQIKTPNFTMLSHRREDYLQ